MYLRVNLPIHVPTAIKATTKGGYTQPTQGTLQEHVAQATRDCDTGPQKDITLFHENQETQQLYLIHINKYREAAKMKRHRNTSQMKDQNKTAKKEQTKWRGAITRCRVQNTCYKDAQ